jgi:8-oxo-dGTP pyrophosphatase MutT (NUDIX family)
MSMHQKNTSIKHITSCGAFVYRLGQHSSDIKILLIKQSKNSDWGIPKGKINLGETHEECAVREVFEETGVRIGLEDKLGECYVSYKHKEKTVIAFLAKQICGNEPRCDGPESEVEDVRWFGINELPPIQAYQLELFNTAKSFLGAKLNERQSSNN